MEVGIGRYEYGKKVTALIQKSTTRSECNGRLNTPSSPCSLFMIFSVSSTVFTADARFVVSGSDDGNVRVWKAKAHEKLGVITARERAVIEYRESLKERWKHDHEISRISR